jgi:hypothetical protein
MEPELETLIAIKKPVWLVGKDFLVLYNGKAVWTILTQLHPDGTFSGLDNAGVAYPGRIRQENLMIGIGARLPEDPVLQALQEYRLKPHLFAVAVPGYGGFQGNDQGDGLRAQGNQVRFGVQPELNNAGQQMGGAPARVPPQMPQVGPFPPAFAADGDGQWAGVARPPPVQIPQGRAETQAAGQEKAPFPQTPAMRILQGGLDNPFHPASTARLEHVIRQLVSKGTLESHLLSVHREINPKMAAWSSKATYLLEIYQETDPAVAHLLAAVYLYATRINYVSPDLEWLSNAYVAEMKMKIEQRGNSNTWTAETKASLEAEMRHAFFDNKAKADTLLGKGVVRPLFDPDKISWVKKTLILVLPFCACGIKSDSGLNVPTVLE